MTPSRFEQLAARLAASQLDAVAINPGPTLTHLTGLSFHLMERPVVLLFAPGQTPVLILPELEAAKLANLPYQLQAFPYSEKLEEWSRAFEGGINALKLNGKKIGVEPRALRILEYRYLEQAAPKASFPEASDVLTSLRLHKDADEIAKMRQAVKIAQAALEATLKLVKIGMSELELGNELVIQMLRQGAQAEMPFAPIVGSGPNSANPHAALTERKIQPGDLLLFDWGAAYAGYVSDLTRTFAVGEIDPQLAKIQQIVQEANAAGRAAGKPGAPCSAVDKAAREVIEKAGYGPLFTHRTGHGIGMEGHEEPYIRGDNPQLLEPGMCYTVEPGIYLRGEGGVRIEDDVVVTESGSEALSDTPREIRVVG